MSASDATIHLKWLLFLAVLVIIGVATWKLGDSNALVRQLSFALTLASLVLAALAIGYSFVSSSSVHETIGTIKASTDDLRVVATDVQASADSMQAAADQVSGHLEGQTKELKQEFRAGFDQLGERRKIDTEADPGRDVTGEQFVQVTPLGGTIVLYAFKLALDARAGFNYQKLRSLSLDAGRVDPYSMYNLGYLVALRDTGWLRYRLLKDHTVVPISLDDGIDAALPEVVAQIADANGDFKLRVEAAEQLIAKPDAPEDPPE